MVSILRSDGVSGCLNRCSLVVIRFSYVFRPTRDEKRSTKGVVGLCPPAPNAFGVGGLSGLSQRSKGKTEKSCRVVRPPVTPLSAGRTVVMVIVVIRLYWFKIPQQIEQRQQIQQLQLSLHHSNQSSRQICRWTFIQKNNCYTFPEHFFKIVV